MQQCLFLAIYTHFVFLFFFWWRNQNKNDYSFHFQSIITNKHIVRMVESVCVCVRACFVSETGRQLFCHMHVSNQFFSRICCVHKPYVIDIINMNRQIQNTICIFFFLSFSPSHRGRMCGGRRENWKVLREWMNEWAKRSVLLWYVYKESANDRSRNKQEKKICAERGRGFNCIFFVCKRTMWSVLGSFDMAIKCNYPHILMLECKYICLSTNAFTTQ